MFARGVAEQTRARNYRHIRELVRISFGLGVNLTSPSCFKESLRILNVTLTVCGVVSLYGHWNVVVRYIDNIPKFAESISTALQTLISVVKMIYYLFMQRRFYKLLQRVQTHEFLYKNFPIHRELQTKVDVVMEETWLNIRRQLIYYICCCIGIFCNYFFGAIIKNTYNQYKETPNYGYELPFPAVYPKWEDKGMSFPHYHIVFSLSGIALYIAAMCAVSFDGVFIVLCMHAVGLLRALKTMILLSTSERLPPECRVEYMRCCIFYYQRINDYMAELNRIYKHVTISQFLFSMVVLGIVLFQMGIGFESDKMTLLRMIMYMSAAGYEVILYCINGQSLTSASEEIPMAFYSCGWYDESPEFKQLVRMMIMRTNRAHIMNISWFSNMSLPTLVAFFKTSGSYFLLLRNVTE